jgi:hypothetical protein
MIEPKETREGLDENITTSYFKLKKKVGTGPSSFVRNHIIIIG